MRPYWIALSVAGLSWACSSDPSGAPPLVGGRAGAAGVAVGGSSGTSGGGTSSANAGAPVQAGGAAGEASGAAGSAGGSGAGQGGDGGTNAGASGSAGASGQANAGASGQAGAPPAVCEVVGSTGCNCQSQRSPTARGEKVCLPGASTPTCDCSQAEPLPASVSAEPCASAVGAPESFRSACAGDSEFPECRVHFSGAAWIASSCADPLGGPTSMTDDAGTVWKARAVILATVINLVSGLG